MKQHYRIFAAIGFAAITTVLSAQPAIVWGKRYNAPPDMADEARALVVDAAGNSYVTGSGFNSGGNLDVITIKYDINGTQMWVRNYDRGTSGNDEGKAIALDAAGNVYVTGYSFGASSSGDAVTIKYDNAGTQLWVSFYDRTNNMDEARSIAVDGSGNAFICGYSSDSLYFFDALTVCYNTSGVEQWSRLYAGPVGGNDELLDLVIDGSSNVYVTGNTEQASINYDILILKYNSAGLQQWMDTLGGTAGGDYGKAITLDQNNNVIVGAQSFVTGNWFDYEVLKYSNAGTQLWTATYNNGNNGSNRFEDLWAIATDNAGYIYVTGQSQATGNNSTPPDATTVKFTPAGTRLWAQRYDGGFNNGDDRAYAMVLDDSANVYVAGYSKNASNTDYITIKYDSAGTQEFVLRFNSQYNQGEQISAIAELNGDIYVTGTSANAANEDYFTIRYSYSAVGIEEPLRSTMNAYPVPCSDVLTVEFGSPLTEVNRITVTDVTGRIVIAMEAPQGATRSAIDIAKLASGTYAISQINHEGLVVSRERIIKN